MSPKQALSFIAKNKWDENIAATVVHLIYKPANRAKIAEYVSQYGGLVRFDEPPPPDCGVPYVEDDIRVAALLEFYFARKLQTSGLVARAYPDELPRTPPFITISLRAIELTNTIKSDSLEIDEKDHDIETFFDKVVRKFLTAKRPTFKGPWQVEIRNSGSRFAYRWEIVGPSISACERTGWEKFNLQVIMNLSDSPEVLIQVVDGYAAPGSFAERPSDTRFKDNPLNDDQLGKIQDAFFDFLVGQKVGFPDPANPNASTSACNL